MGLAEIATPFLLIKYFFFVSPEIMIKLRELKNKKGMGKTINYQTDIRKIIFRFIDPREYKVFIFGSRVTGQAQKFSDYDIGIQGKKMVPGYILAMAEEALEESDIPYKVDLVDLSLVSPQFREVALSQIKEL